MKAILVFLTLPLLAQQEKERALGQHLAAEIRRQSKPIDNAAVESYVKRIGSELVARLPETPWSYSFEVVVTGAKGPMPLPGGHVFIPAAFFLAVQNEDEFAGMLAHTIGHIALRHGTRNVNTSGVPLIFMGGWCIHQDSQAGSVLIPIGYRPVVRGYELDADTFAVGLAHRAGYDPAALRTYIQRIPLEDRDSRLANIDKLPPQAQPSSRKSNDEFLRAREALR